MTVPSIPTSASSSAARTRLRIIAAVAAIVVVIVVVSVVVAVKLAGDDATIHYSASGGPVSFTSPETKGMVDHESYLPGGWTIKFPKGRHAGILVTSNGDGSALSCRIESDGKVVAEDSIENPTSGDEVRCNYDIPK